MGVVILREGLGLGSIIGSWICCFVFMASLATMAPNELFSMALVVPICSICVNLPRVLMLRFSSLNHDL